MACTGLEVDAAIIEYLTIVEKIAPNLKGHLKAIAAAPSGTRVAATSNTPKSRESSRFASFITNTKEVSSVSKKHDSTATSGTGSSSSVNSSSSNGAGSKQMTDMSGVVKEGVLYKKRDHLIGWRERYFRLQDNFLHYYTDPSDAVPKRTMALAGINVTNATLSKSSDKDYFQFTISHPNSKDVYILASEFKVDADSWIEKIRELAADAGDEIVPEVVDNTHSTAEVADEPEIDQDYPRLAESALPWTSNPSESLRGTPAKFIDKIESAVKAIQAALAPDADGWQLLFEKNGVVAKRRHGSVLTVRGDGVANHPLHKVFGLLLDTERSAEYNSQIAEDKKLQEYSRHTSLQYLKFKQVF